MLLSSPWALRFAAGLLFFSTQSLTLFAASACVFGASTILVSKLAGDTISSTSKSSGSNLAMRDAGT